MANNKPMYGFRWSIGGNGRPHPAPLETFCVSAQSFDVNGGASNVGLGPGDLVTRLNSGGVKLCDGIEGAGGIEIPYAVVVGVKPYYNATTGLMTPSYVLPSDVTYGTNLERQSRVLVVPVEWGLWEADCDTALASLAAFQLVVGLNVNTINTGASGDTRARPELDISEAAVTATFHWRIEGISPIAENVDFTGTNVKLIVRANAAQSPPYDFDGI